MNRVKHLCVGAALVAALAIPAVAGGAPAKQLFVGEFADQDDSVVRLKTGVGEDYTVKTFGAHEFVVSCEGEADGIIDRAALKGSIAVGNSDRFHARDDDGDTTLNVRGEIGANKATGMFRFSGELEGEDGETHECDSGRLEWKARITD